MEDKNATKFVVWKEEYSVGRHDLDSQHQIILEIINELFEEISGSSEADLTTIIKRLNDYTFSHLADEEHYMANHGFPDLDDHAAAHHILREKTGKFHQRYKTDNNELSYEMLQFLKAWWVGHIIQIDSRYATYINRTNKS